MQELFDAGGRFFAGVILAKRAKEEGLSDDKVLECRHL
jgi:hypothetical protein